VIIISTFNYYIGVSGVIERGLFYNYLVSIGYKSYGDTREEMINSPYPFAICMKRKEFVIIKSATMCYLNEKAGKFRTVEEFKKIVDKRNWWLKK
jgi:hypothetical protein